MRTRRKRRTGRRTTQTQDESSSLSDGLTLRPFVALRSHSMQYTQVPRGCTISSRSFPSSTDPAPQSSKRPHIQHVIAITACLLPLHGTSTPTARPRKFVKRSSYISFLMARAFIAYVSASCHHCTHPHHPARPSRRDSRVNAHYSPYCFVGLLAPNAAQMLILGICCSTAHRPLRDPTRVLRLDHWVMCLLRSQFVGVGR